MSANAAVATPRRYVLCTYTKAGKVETVRMLDVDQRIALEIALQERGVTYVLTPEEAR